jgi:hypothetical protein
MSVRMRLLKTGSHGIRLEVPFVYLLIQYSSITILISRASFDPSFSAALERLSLLHIRICINVIQRESPIVTKRLFYQCYHLIGRAPPW